jgi:hypothetical protein
LDYEKIINIFAQISVKIGTNYDQTSEPRFKQLLISQLSSQIILIQIKRYAASLLDLDTAVEEETRARADIEDQVATSERKGKSSRQLPSSGNVQNHVSWHT